MENKFEWNELELKASKNRIMKRVNFVWFMRRVFVPASTILAVSLGALLYAVKAQFVAVIVKNITDRALAMDIAGLAKYLATAFAKTELDLLVLSASSMLLILYFGRRLVIESISYWSKSSLTFSPRQIK